MTDNNDYDEYTKGLIEAIITAADNSSITFDTLKLKRIDKYLDSEDVFSKFLMNIGFTTPDGSALAQSTNDYFYNSIDDVKKIDENGMYFKWKQKLKEKSNQDDFFVFHYIRTRNDLLLLLKNKNLVWKNLTMKIRLPVKIYKGKDL